LAGLGIAKQQLVRDRQPLEAAKGPVLNVTIYNQMIKPLYQNLCF